jgi:hypothetical protein
MLPSWVFKRIVPPHAGLLRPYVFTIAFPVLDGLLRRVSLWEGLPRVLSEADKGISLPRARREIRIRSVRIKEKNDS